MPELWPTLSLSQAGLMVWHDLVYYPDHLIPLFRTGFFPALFIPLSIKEKPLLLNL